MALLFVKLMTMVEIGAVKGLTPQNSSDQGEEKGLPTRLFHTESLCKEIIKQRSTAGLRALGDIGFAYFLSKLL